MYLTPFTHVLTINFAGTWGWTLTRLTTPSMTGWPWPNAMRGYRVNWGRWRTTSPTPETRPARPPWTGSTRRTSSRAGTSTRLWGRSEKETPKEGSTSSKICKKPWNLVLLHGTSNTGCVNNFLSAENSNVILWTLLIRNIQIYLDQTSKITLIRKKCRILEPSVIAPCKAAPEWPLLSESTVLLLLLI